MLVIEEERGRTCEHVFDLSLHVRCHIHMTSMDVEVGRLLCLGGAMKRAQCRRPWARRGLRPWALGSAWPRAQAWAQAWARATLVRLNARHYSRPLGQPTTKSRDKMGFSGGMTESARCPRLAGAGRAHSMVPHACKWVASGHECTPASGGPLTRQGARPRLCASLLAIMSSQDQ